MRAHIFKVLVMAIATFSAVSGAKAEVHASRNISCAELEKESGRLQKDFAATIHKLGETSSTREQRRLSEAAEEKRLSLIECQEKQSANGCHQG
jgi:hypothetical protein